ncbi:MAG: putative glycoside hydrolase [bacterium]|nr:putative glycoside hydrolase [bacterium]
MKYWITGSLAAVIIPTFLFFLTNNVKVELPIDEGYPKPLTNPPAEIRALYATSWSATSQEKMDYLIDLVSTTAANAIIVDIKDYSGIVSYSPFLLVNKIESSSSSLPLAEKYGALTNRIKDINPFVENMHRNNVYLIGRITVFQDPILAKARPDLAVKDPSGAVWKDNKGLSWMDTANKEVWDYNLAIAKDLFKRGFDEVNFDYIRFPSDGQGINSLVFPAWDKTVSKREVVRSFFQYLRENLPDKRISADIFGQTTVTSDDFGIGQVIEDAYRYFDYVAPMVYPSHFINGFIGYSNPAEHPYEVIEYSMEEAAKRYVNYEAELLKNSTSTGMASSTSILKSKLRPWFQAFDLGAVYTPEMIRKQIEAMNEVKSRYPKVFDGYFLWSPKNNYSASALIE